MRKPNLTEAITQFTQLSNSFRHEGSPHYSAFCSLAVARCEQAMHSESSQEAGHCYDAGTTLWEVATECETRNYTGVDDDVTEAINCYLLAIKIYMSHQRYGIAGQLYSEMGSYLSKMGHHSLAAEFTAQSALLRQRDSPMTAARLWYDTANYRIAAVDYKSASECLLNCIKILNTVTKSPSAPTVPLTPQTPQNNKNPQAMAINLTAVQGATPPGEQNVSITTHSQMLLEARISLILIHIMQDMFLSAKDNIGKLVLDDGMGESSDDVVSLLQTLVTSCEKKEASGLYVIQRELWYSLTPIQNELLYSIINAYSLLL
eukprot:Phypoly_transcript_12833.p1 GENE.Phypoly_transcript_12833~~Phypoly_transcript_12833.p1  ORF type:complete len:361 (+),score=47.71 Phypoly_transcript_12833:130-1083(+)